MKVGLAIYGSIDTATGGYLYDRMLVKHLRERGDEVTIFSMVHKTSELNLLDNFDVRLLRLLASADLDALVQDELNFRSFCLLNRRLAKEVGYPIVSLVHNLSCSAERCGERTARLRSIEKRYLSTVDGFIFNSLATRSAVRELCPKAEGPIAYPGKDHDPILGSQEARFGWPLRVVFLGNIFPHKGLDVLIKGATQLPRGAVTIDVVGAPLDQSHLKDVNSLISSHDLGGFITFHGRVDRTRKEAILSSSQVLAVPSFYEGYGLVFVEALAHGLPVIAPMCGGAGEIVTDGREGYLVPPGDNEAVAWSLASLSDEATWTEMSANARQRYTELPTWSESMDKARAYLLEASKDKARFERS